MELLLMRHGAALDRGAPGIRCDADRPLSDEGRAVTCAVADTLLARGSRPDLVLTSPLKRAVQTATLVAACCGDLPVQECGALAPGATPPELVDALQHCHKQCVLAVGHMPDLSELALYLLCGIPLDRLIFATSGVCLIRFEGQVRADAGAMEWLAPPPAL